MSLTPEQTLCSFLNAYLFHKVFNATEAEYRGNIIARCASTRETIYTDPETQELKRVTRLVSVSNFTDIAGGRIQLPDNKSYYLYQIPQTAMRGLRIRTASWQRLGDFLNSNCLDLRITTKDGLWLYRNQIFVCGHPTEKAYLLAIDVNMLRNIAGKDYDATKIYVSVYYDSDQSLEAKGAVHRENQATYSVGEVAIYPGKLSHLLVCAIAGTTANTLPAWPASGNTLVDGTVTWNIVATDTVKSQYFYLSDNTVKNAFLTAAKAAGVTSVVMNGKFCKNLDASQVYLGYYGEVITDPDKEFEFDIDLTDQDACRYYRSDDTNEFKYILHIPKANNPEKYVYTHNTVDFYLFPKNGSNNNIHGIFLHRFNTADAIGQLTHQDFWMSERLIQAYMSYMDTTDLVMRVLVRRHSKTQTLIEDSNYLPLLYELSDKQILDHMEGLGPDNLWFWRASNLEKSVYMTLMFKSILKAPIEVSTLSKYIDAIGYYNVMAAVCKRVTRAYLQSDTQDFVINLPVGLSTATNLYAHLWVNKRRVSPNIFTVIRNSRRLQADFHVTEALTLHEGDQITTEIFDRYDAKAERFIPSSSNRFIPTGTEKIRIFSIHDINEEVFPLNPISREFNCDYAYQEWIPEELGEYGTDTTTGKSGFIFNTAHAKGDTEYLIITKNGLVCINKTIPLADIRGKLCTTGLMLVNLYGFSETEDSTPESVKYVTTYDVPILWDGIPMVFINGRELANKIDYCTKVYTTESGKFVAKVIHISNASYFCTYDLINDADGSYTEIYDSAAKTYRYVFSNRARSYLLCEKGSLPIDTTSAGAVAQLVHILNTDPEEYGIVFTPSSSSPDITVTSKKDIYPVTKVIQEGVEKFIITGLTLSQKTNHSFEVEYTTDDCFHDGTDFLVDQEMWKRDVTLFYHDTLSMIHADGLPIQHVTKDHYGYLGTDDEDVRNGAFMYHRGVCPNWLVSVLDKYGDKEQDIERLGSILTYLDEIDPRVYPEFIITDRSHHICSVIVNKVIDDSKTGILNLSYDADEKNMLHQIESYLPLIDEDPAMIGSSGEIIVHRCGIENFNATYTPLTVFVRGYNKGKDRVWINEERNAQIRWYPDERTEQGLAGRWVLENRLHTQKTFYYAIDDDGIQDPWNLVWLVGTDGTGNTPVVKFGGLNLRFIDIDPSYAEVSYKDQEHYKCILQIMKGLLPEDATKDGGNQ